LNRGAGVLEPQPKEAEAVIEPRDELGAPLSRWQRGGAALRPAGMRFAGER
jgi:hypothetical protein